tara:strand:+ start:15207 stop:16835 length:1629 start_codon:yes stop_codon:yes gene_type:complete
MSMTDEKGRLRARAMLRLARQWWQRKYVADVEHEAVEQQVRAEGRLTSRYTFMVTMSCAIAMLGLLLSSPAVVIGAMLISPLMAPIMSLGFSLCVLDARQMRKALEGLVIGIVTALAISFIIVRLSPLTDATPEILARTQPNLFDLLVAIFSGLAGGYAVIKRKGEAIVGVAIATALMPPLAVVGFGLATGNMMIAKGAFMLFMTNLLAISLSVTLLAKFYGFSSGQGRIHTAWQLALIVTVFGVLSLPLGVALKNIAYQSYITKVAQNTIADYFGANKVRISIFKINFAREDGPLIDTVVLTSEYHDRAQSELTTALREKTGSDIDLSLDQVVVAHEMIAAPALPQANNTIAPQAVAVVTQRSRADEMTASLQQAVFFPVEYIRVDGPTRLAIIYAKPAKGVSIATLHQFEASLAARYPDWVVRVVPHVQALPPVTYETGAETPNEDGMERLDDIIWTLLRWDVGNVEVVGFASTRGELSRFDNTSLAYRRAKWVRAKLLDVKIVSAPRAEYRSFRQRDDEEEYGINRFQRVDVRPMLLDD